MGRILGGITHDAITTSYGQRCIGDYDKFNNSNDDYYYYYGADRTLARSNVTLVRCDD
jgi:hypothetical protein